MDHVDHRQQEEDGSPATRRARLQADPSLDRLTCLAADLLQVSHAAIYRLVERHLQLASRSALDGSEPFDIERFCRVVVDADAPLILHAIDDHEGLAALPPGRGSGFFAGLPLHTPAGLPLGVLCIADARPRHDVAAAQNATFTTLAGLAADLLHHRLAADSRRASAALLATLGHDLRTPMNGVLGMAELLLAGDDLAAGHRRRIDVIKRSGQSVLAMVDSMLELARLDAREPDAEASWCDFRQLLRTVIGELGRKETGRSQDFHLVDGSVQRCLPLGSSAHIRTLLSRFLEIARRHAAGGPVAITTSTEKAGAGRLQLRLTAEFVAPDDDPLDQTFSSSPQATSIASSRAGDTVIALVLCRKLLAMLGGEIGLERQADGRSILWLTLPTNTPRDDHSEGSACKPSEAPASHGDTSRAPRRILDVLVAEDDPDMAMLIKDLVEEGGHRATVVHDGASVLQLLDHEPFDVVVLDGRMPDMSGLETARRIRQLPQKRAEIPIIALTGEVLAGDRERYLAAGMNAYVPKPVDYNTLIDTIDRCCSR